MSQLPIHRAILVVLLTLSALPVFSQNLSALYDLVGDSDTKSIDNAIEQIREAGKLTQEANVYYNELLALQNNYELSEKALQRKLAKAESNALKTQIKADKIYTETYASLFKLCETKLRDSKSNYGENGSLESEASRLIGEAAEKRGEAKDSNEGIKKVSLLNEAASLDNAALDNMILALQVQMGIVPESTTEEYLADYSTEPAASSPSAGYVQQPAFTPAASPGLLNTSQISENLAINNAVISDYNRYINDPTIPYPITINRSGVSGVSEASVDEARRILQKDAAQESTFQIQQPQDSYSSSEESAPVVKVENATEYSEIDFGEDSYESEIKSVEPNENTPEEYNPGTEQVYTQPDQSADTRSYTDLSASPQRNDVIFSIQIAASRVPLTRSQVWAIYSGNQTIEVIHEEGWFKYRLTGFRLYSQAQRVANESGVNGAWVIAQSGGQTLEIPEAREMTKLLETNTNQYGQGAVGQSIDYYLQVAASRLRLSEQILNRICLEKSLCREVIEEGWFKYQVFAGTNLNTALELKSRFRPEAFIVGYVNGSKSNIYNR